MWLTGRLAPDFKAIADFRKDNGEAIGLVCRSFVMLCRKLGLLNNTLVAIDGSKFKAVNNRDKNFTRAKMKRRLAEVEASVDRYLTQLTEVDATETDDDKGQVLQDKIAALKEEMAQLKKHEVRMLEAADKQLSLTDPDARSMKSRDTGLVGYYNGDEIRACEQAGIDTYLPKPKISPNKAKGLFDRSAFTYIDEDDEYQCPAGERLTHRTTTTDKGKKIKRYWTSTCPSCVMKSQCTTGKERRVSRWVHEDVLDRAQARLEKKPDAMLTQRATVEHPFGTIKSWMGATHFQMKTLPRVSTEMSLHVLAYNMKRAINLLGPKEILAAIRA